VLDVGVGFGKLGFLIREYLEARNGRLSKKQWKIELIGVEIHRPYISIVQNTLYDKIVYGHIAEKLSSLGKFDVAVLSDILEHMEKQEGHALLERLQKQSKYILVALPYGWKEQKSIGKNKHEEHKSGWLPADFKRYKIVEQVVIKRITKKEKALVILLR
jgi:hypothetical protein